MFYDINEDTLQNSKYMIFNTCLLNVIFLAKEMFYFTSILFIITLTIVTGDKTS